MQAVVPERFHAKARRTDPRLIHFHQAGVAQAAQIGETFNRA